MNASNGNIRDAVEQQLTPGQRRMVFARARELGLRDPERELKSLLEQLFPGRDLDHVGGDRELDRLLAALPTFAERLCADTKSDDLIRRQFNRVKAGRGCDGDWENAAASFLRSVQQSAAAGPCAPGWLLERLTAISLPVDFIAEVRRQVNGEKVA